MTPYYPFTIGQLNRHWFRTSIDITSVASHEFCSLQLIQPYLSWQGCSASIQLVIKGWKFNGTLNLQWNTNSGVFNTSSGVVMTLAITAVGDCNIHHLEWSEVIHPFPLIVLLMWLLRFRTVIFGLLVGWCITPALLEDDFLQLHWISLFFWCF